MPGFRKCGKDTQLISDLMGSKTKEQVDAFYDMFKTQYQLEKVPTPYSCFSCRSSSPNTRARSTLIESRPVLLAPFYYPFRLDFSVISNQMEGHVIFWRLLFVFATRKIS